MDIIEAIEARSSVRTFSGEHLSAAENEAIREAVKNVVVPLPGSWAIDLQLFELDGPQRPGTYGVIKGAGDYLLLGFDGSDFANAVAAGFAMEQVVLECTRLGLGTCWMSGTFKTGDFAAKAAFPGAMELQAVIPVGRPAGRERFIERLTRFTVGSKNRKPLGKMFYVGEWERQVTDSSMFYESLMMMSLAPSSTNSQPWRALIKGETVHFYCKDANKNHCIDMGIGLSHFALTESYRGHSGSWSVDRSRAPEAPASLTYIASYTRL